MPFSRFSLCLSLALVTFAPSRTSAQSVQGSAKATQAPKPAPKPPEFKNLRFEEDWTSSHSGHWDQAIKGIPILPGKPVWLTLGGQARWRFEAFRSFNMLGQDDDNSQSRMLLHGDLQAGNRKGLHARVFGEWRDAQSYGRDLPGGARPNDADRNDVQNLFADVAYGASFIRYGRQEIATNRERMFGVPDWSNTRRGSQGTRVQLTRWHLTLEAMDARPMVVRQSAPNRADSTARFRTLSFGSATGANAYATGLPDTWQGYFYQQDIHTSTTSTRRNTGGGRTMWHWGKTPSRRAYSLELEGALQRGTTGARDLDGWFWIAESQVLMKQWHGAPSLALGVEEASGEHANTANAQEAFAVLYPAAHAHGGYADVIGRTNVRELHLISTWDPAAAVNLRAAWYRFDRLRLDDGVYNKQNGVFRAANGSTDRHAADELDVTGTWKATRHWRVIAGGAVVLPGAFMVHTPGSATTEHWGFAGTTFTF